MKPWSPSPWTVGASRTTDERTPREARESVSCAVARRIAGPLPGVAAGPGSCPSRSVATRPGASPSVPEAMTNGRSEPASASPNVSMARRSASAAPSKSPEKAMSCLNARWITPSDAAAALAQDVEIVEGAALHLGSGGGEGGGRGVRAGEPDDLMAGADQLGNDGGADPAGRAGDEDTHENLQVSLMSVAVITLPR